MPNYLICPLLCTTMLLLSWQDAVDAFSPISATRPQYQGRKRITLRWVDDQVVTHTPELTRKENHPKLMALERAVDCAAGLIECDLDDEEDFINERIALSEECTLSSNYEQEEELCGEQMAAYDAIRHALDLRRELAWLAVEIEDNRFVKEQKKLQSTVNSVSSWYDDYLYYHN